VGFSSRLRGGTILPPFRLRTLLVGYRYKVINDVPKTFQYMESIQNPWMEEEKIKIRKCIHSSDSMFFFYYFIPSGFFICNEQGESAASGYF
jgi:hypothetical protein